MQKRVRKNSDYICAKKPKLDIPVNSDQEKYESNTMSSQYVHPKEIDLKSEPFARSLSTAECSEFTEINISENAPSVSSNIKTFVKLDPSDSDTVELKEIFKKVLQTEESIDEHIKCPSSVTSESPNKNLCPATSMNVQQEKSQNTQEFSISAKNENDSLESLSNFKLSHRENDILIDFETSASNEGTSSHVVPDANAICIPATENEMFKSDSNSTKDAVSIKRSTEALPINVKLSDDTNARKPNQQTSMGNLNIGPAPPLELTAISEKKIVPADQTTAKVSIGNATISVPLLKNVNFRRIVGNDGKTVSNIVRKVINIHGKKIKAPTIVQVSQVHLNPKTNTKIVQATLVGNKIQLPNIGFKSSSNFKTNFVPAPQCPTMALTSLPKQIFEEESSQSSQPSNQTTDENDQKPTEQQALNNVNKSVVKSKEPMNKQITTDGQVQKPNQTACISQFRVIETDSTIPPKSFASITTNASQNTLTVTSSSDGAHPKLTTSVSKPTRKPIMLTKMDMVSGAAVSKDFAEVIRNTNTISGDTSQPKENQIIAENTTISKMDENLPLREQIAIAVQNCNRYQLKVTKTTEDPKAKKTGDFVGLAAQAKRQFTKLSPVTGQSPTNEPALQPNVDKVEKSNTSKSENELLKKLLQSSINQRSNSANNQTIAPRKLATVRAPSLGVVSSLEAQLARPVIPPVSSVGEMKPELKLPSKIANDKLKKNTPTDREKINFKSRPEMISRETSFVSTFSSKQRIPSNQPEANERMQTVQTNQSNQTNETDTSKAMLFQTTTSNNFNSINLFKFFKQKEQSKSGTSETNSNPSQSPIGTNEDNADMKLSIKTENDNTGAVEAGCSPSIKTKLVKMDNEQNIELKKRYKRDFQKHKRQILLNKEPQNHQKKKSRKLSKACEDFDEFIENKVIQMKQMFVLEVLEPLLSTFLGICSVYGYNDKVRNQVEYAYHNVFKEDFGKTNLKNLVDFYSVKPYGPYHGNKAKSVPSFQNKFYDEEFSTMNHETCDKLFQFINTLKLQSLQSSDNISLVSTSPSSETPSHSHSHPNINYPGIKFPNDFTHNTDRMSPIIPLISANNFGVIKRNKPGHYNRNKSSYGNIETRVMLKLSSFVAENILDILRDLDNLLNVHSPVSYKLQNKEKLNVRNIKGLYISRIRNLQKTESTNIQNFLNGTYKCCRNCHLTIICGIIGADSNSNIKKRILADSHFCDKFCCIQYKKKGRKFVVSRKRERFYQNNLSVNRVSTNNDNNFNSSSNYKIVGPNSFWKSSYKGIANEDVNEIYMKMRVAITLNTNKDIRRCILCNQKGDSLADGSSRLLNYDVNKWVHLNCALWSNSVYETINGGLMNLELTMQQGVHQICSYCNQNGASIKCFKQRCGHVYHLPCALKKHCVFYKNKTINCAVHAHRMEKKNELNSIRVRRRVYIERDENRQVAAVMHHLELSNLLRIGNLTFINVGQLLPHQLDAFHTPNYIYPIGYKIIRFFWSMKKLNKRCRYICSIAETNGRPEFVIQVQEPFESDVELRDISPKAVWQRVLDKIVLLRKGQAVVQLFTEFMCGEDLFGLSEPSIVRILESLPGVESLTDYRFKYGRNPLLELPLALNPSGSARTEPKQRHIINWKKAHTQRTSSINLKLTLSPTSLVAGEVACPYSKQFVHSKSSQYRKMKQEWRNNVYLARSKIQGLGLYAARDLEKHTMVIEYIGQVIRTEVSELREKQYDLRNRGIYMFRLDEERVVDATLSGGLARYINHSCNPNCVTEIVDVDREYRIIIFAKRRINKGEELSYDYKFDIEDDANKISCMCDAPNCRKWMN